MSGSTVSKRAFRLAYDGRPFHGFQRQPDVPTVEGALFEALRALDLAEKEPEGYTAAGRTDAGASAAAQTVAFACPDWCSPGALNGQLPRSIRAWAAAEVDPGFHATHDALRREYTYHLHAPDADDGRVRDAASRLAGEHDFHNLSLADAGTVRDLSLDVARDGDYLVVTARAGGFPRGFVRKVASLLRAVGTRDAALAKVDRVLDPEPLDGPEGVPLAPAYPLVLAGVRYDARFERDPDAADAAREAFRDRRIEHGTRSRVAGTIAGRI